MSYTATYSPLFTGSIENPRIGVRIEDYENFEHLIDIENLAFEPSTKWITKDMEAYPRTEYAYLYGFEYPSNDDVYLSSITDTFSLNKVAPGYHELFTKTWYLVAMTCEPFSVLMNPSSGNFPPANWLVTGRGEDYVHRLDCEPGRIEIWDVPLFEGEETLRDEFEWDTESYEDERFLGGANY